MKPTRILVTGSAGFIGSNLMRQLFSRYPDAKIFGMDLLTYASGQAWVDEFLIRHPEAARRAEFFHGFDITDPVDAQTAMDVAEPDLVFHLAAESHVCNSIESPEKFMNTNVMGTYRMLEAALKTWGKGAENRFVHVSTDEIFGEAAPGKPFTERTQIKPRSPYAASKAASDHIVSAFHHTYGMNTVITNCSNNYGPNQHRENLIPKTIISFMAGEPATLYGDGHQVRDWLHVYDHCTGLVLAAERGRAGERYLFGGRNHSSNRDIIKDVAMAYARAKGIQHHEYQVHFDLAARRTDDRCYLVDPKKAEEELGWESNSRLFVMSLEDTVRWYLDNTRSNTQDS